jgi:predicted DsbA family dithiol-disulfide isomerase
VFIAAALAASFGCSDRRAAASPDTAPAERKEAQRPAASAAPLPVDLGALRDSERSAFGRLIQKYPSACGKAHSLEVSLRSDPRCRRSVFAARYLVRLFKAHLLESEVEEQYEGRFGVTPRLDVDVKEAPLRGEPHAPVTIVEFSDFQCPHCKHLQPILERLLDDYRGQVKLYFKNFPLSSHHDSETAAAGALAAGKQGKFWQFHDRLFGGDQEHEEMPQLEKIARDLKLDLKKWKSDLDAAKPRVARDRADGEKIEVQATPTLVLNGRRYKGSLDYDDLKDWVDEELNK